MSDGRRVPSWVKRFGARTFKAAAYLGGAAFAALLLVAWDARSRLPDLEPWHRVHLAGEIKAGDLGSSATFDHYLRREDALFAELRREVYDRTPGLPKYALCRYNPKSPSCPLHRAPDYNRSFELSPAEPVGGVLLVHGLSDSPYSVRGLAECLFAQGFYVLAPRMPGHGTVPSGLREADWEDWLAVVKLGALRVRERAGPDKPLYVGGYSNGGALCLLYTLESLHRPELPRPDRVVLLSPAVGITKVAALAYLLEAFSAVPLFEKSAWSEVYPEYDPYKYNSFPLHAAEQSLSLARTVQGGIAGAAERGALSALPPVLTFQSLVDSTVKMEDTVTALYARLPRGRGHELVLFDINRQAALQDYFTSPPSAFLDRLMGSGPLPYRLTLITNRDPASREVEVRSRGEGGGTFEPEPLDARWPEGVYSLSHVAIPFRPDDPLYGIESSAGGRTRFALGNLSLRGEKGVLSIPLENLMRLRCNPFFGYVERRLGEAVAADLAGERGRGAAAGQVRGATSGPAG